MISTISDAANRVSCENSEFLVARQPSQNAPGASREPGRIWH